MRIGIWHQSGAKLDGEQVRVAPAGGAEAAIVHTAEALAGLGAEVDVWANCNATLYFEGVRYVPNHDADIDLRKERYDAFVIVRSLDALQLPFLARGTFYWALDNLEASGSGHDADLAEALEGDRVQSVFASSQWQADRLTERSRIAQGSLHVIGNGLSIAAQKLLGVREHKHPFVLHTLPPDRALAELIAIFPGVRRRVPRAQLHAYSGSTIHGVDQALDQERFGALYEQLGRIEGAKRLDPVEPRALYSFLRRASVWAYPTRVEEAFSVSTLEAQAGGAVPVVSAVGALPERIEHGVDGFLVPGDPAEESVRAEFEDYIVRLLEDDDLRDRMSRAARERALAPSAGYGAVAARMLSVLEAETQGRDLRERTS